MRIVLIQLSCEFEVSVSPYKHVEDFIVHPIVHCSMKVVFTQVEISDE
jgi:hypothetical protein